MFVEVSIKKKKRNRALYNEQLLSQKFLQVEDLFCALTISLTSMN